VAAGGPGLLRLLGVNVAEEGHDGDGVEEIRSSQGREGVAPGQARGVGVDHDQPTAGSNALEELGGLAHRADLRPGASGGFPDTAQQHEIVHQGKNTGHRKHSIAIMAGEGTTGMKSLKGTRTHDNLKLAFAAESQANQRYLYYARAADIEGYPDVGGLFRNTSEAETGHACGHLDLLKSEGDPATGLPFGDTRKNLVAAIEGETHESTQMYPGMAKTAREEGLPEVADWFETLAKAERSHAGRLTKALEDLKEL